MWGVQGELWCRDADHEVSEVYCQFQHVLLAPTNAWYVKTWAVGMWVDTFIEFITTCSDLTV